MELDFNTIVAALKKDQPLCDKVRAWSGSTDPSVLIRDWVVKSRFEYVSSTFMAGLSWPYGYDWRIAESVPGKKIVFEYFDAKTDKQKTWTVHAVLDGVGNFIRFELDPANDKQPSQSLPQAPKETTAVARSRAIQDVAGPYTFTSK